MIVRGTRSPDAAYAGLKTPIRVFDEVHSSSSAGGGHETDIFLHHPRVFHY
jgi:hypothetical protein